MYNVKLLPNGNLMMPKGIAAVTIIIDSKNVADTARKVSKMSSVITQISIFGAGAEAAAGVAYLKDIQLVKTLLNSAEGITGPIGIGIEAGLALGAVYTADLASDISYFEDYGDGGHSVAVDFTPLDCVFGLQNPWTCPE